MNYVKHFDICGVHTRQVACIELHGKPTAATEGAVGVLGIDMDSPSRQVYKCVAVNGSVYTWELLCEGSNIMSASVAGKAYETVGFRYTDLQKSESYTVRVGDLILDTEGYLYRVFAISSDSCTASYCGTQLVIGSDINTDELDERYVQKDDSTSETSPLIYTNDSVRKHYLGTVPKSYTPYNIPMLYGSAAGGDQPSGYLITHTPAKDYHCANKKYVDDNCGWKLITQDLEIATTSTIDVHLADYTLYLITIQHHDNDTCVSALVSNIHNLSSSFQNCSTPFSLGGELMHIECTENGCTIKNINGDPAYLSATINIYGL